MRKVKTLLLSALILGAAGAHANGWQDTPTALNLQPMGDSLRMNGTPMIIRSFSTDMPLDVVLRDVQSNWERPGSAPVKRTKLPTWTVLNQTVGDQHRSIQARQNGALVEGFVALTSPKATREPTLALRMPPQVTAMQVIDSTDNGKVSQQIVAVSRRSVDATAMALEASLKAEGWTRHLFKKHNGGIIVSANRGEQQFDANLSAQKSGALVMISTVK